MVLLDDNLYQETKEIALGKREIRPLLQELADWFMQSYSIAILNYHFSKLEGPGELRHRLYVIVKTNSDYQRVRTSYGYNAVVQQQAAECFRKLSKKYHSGDEAKLANLFVAFNDFEEEAKTNANWKANDEVSTQITGAYTDVWKVISVFSRTVVFYYADADVTAYKRNGISQEIKELYYSILKNYDTLNYYTRENIVLPFDSKENLDKNYEGSLFYYSR